MAKYAFKKGWDQLPNAKLGEARRKLMTALNLKGDSNFYRRLRGIPEPTISKERPSWPSLKSTASPKSGGSDTWTG